MDEIGTATSEDNIKVINELRSEIDRLTFELIKKDKKLSIKDEEIQKHLYTVSHELKTPLVSMKGFSSLLLAFHKESLDKEVANYLERINRNILQMEQLINDLLEYTKIQITKAEFESIHSSTIIEQALSELQYQLGKNQIQLEIEENLPLVSCQRNQMVRVFTNLISNAIKYSHKDKKPEIKIGYRSDEIFHKFYVKDNGVGIPANQRDKLFQLFNRLGNKKGVSGTGVGLAIVKRIIEGHGGEIWAESHRGKGTTFFFTLPKLRAATQPTCMK